MKHGMDPIRPHSARCLQPPAVRDETSGDDETKKEPVVFSSPTPCPCCPVHHGLLLVAVATSKTHGTAGRACVVRQLSRRQAIVVSSSSSRTVVCLVWISSSLSLYASPSDRDPDPAAIHPAPGLRVHRMRVMRRCLCRGAWYVHGAGRTGGRTAGSFLSGRRRV